MKFYSLFFLIAALLLSGADMDAQRRGKRGRKTDISLEGTVFHIRNVKAQKYIDVSGTDDSNKARSNGVNVQLWTLDGGDDQKFKFVPAGNGYYHIQSQHKRMNLDVHGCYDGKWFCGTYKNEKGANVQMWSAGSSEPQQWKLIQASPGKWFLKNRYSGKYLDARDSHIHRNGCNIMQWSKNGNDNQIWELVSVKTGKRYQK